MQYITTTELRTKSSKLVKTLKGGGTLRLIHRSKVIGQIMPIYEPKPFDAKKFEKLVKNLKLPKTTYAQREKIYRAHLMKKYGKGLS
ncbi:hypothetical protein HYW42_03450 [Candidatus Daviesbacteria bacterium]|nr:hypothetical protein [Candidatus Daviesbacteria bacterium]